MKNSNQLAIEFINESIGDIELRELLIKFSMIELSNNPILKYRNLREIFRAFINVYLDEIDWNMLCSQVMLLSGTMDRTTLLVKFYQYLLSHDYWLGEYTDYLKENKWIIDSKSIYYYKKLKDIYFIGSNPQNMYLYKSKLNNESILIYLNCKSDELRDLLRSFINYKQNKGLTESGLYNFFWNFELSLGIIEHYNNIFEAFNIKSFCNQYRFYSQYHDKGSSLMNLKSFYIFLCEYLEELNSSYCVFKIEDGIEINFLKRRDFNPLFEAGYRVVYYNKYDTTSSYDKWLINPNGYEKYSTAIRSDNYISIDFTRIRNHHVRKKVKEFVISTSTKSLPAVKKMVNNLLLFFEFIEGSGTNSIIQNKASKLIKATSLSYYLNVDNILLFRTYINENYRNDSTNNAYVTAIRTFVNYLIGIRENDISIYLLDFLRVRSRKENVSRSILDEDLNRIAGEIKKRAIEGDYIDKLFWVFIHTLVTTNFRPNEILNLSRNCIIETMKDGEYAISSEKFDKIESSREQILMGTKTSSGCSIERNPSEYTIRSIREAISLTNELSYRASDDVKNYIFIKENPSKHIVSISLNSYYRYFKGIVRNLSLIGEDYTLSNIRHTFMTKLFNEAIKNGDVFKAALYSGHRDINTMLKRYVDKDIRSQMEAMYHIELGKVDIYGNVVRTIDEVIENPPKDLREITVKNGCGFCKGQCKYGEEVDCLCCRNFIVTLDRMPYFQETIRKLDMQISNETIQHEREHLISIKRLYVAYLEAMINLMREIESDGK